MVADYELGSVSDGTQMTAVVRQLLVQACSRATVLGCAQLNNTHPSGLPVAPNDNSDDISRQLPVDAKDGAYIRLTAECLERN